MTTDHEKAAEPMRHIMMDVTDVDGSTRFYGGLGFGQALRWRSEDGSVEIVHLFQDQVFLELRRDAPQTVGPTSGR